MKILAADNDKASLNALKEILKKTVPDAGCFFFEESPSALAKARDEEINAAFLGIQMRELSGMDLGRYLKELNPFINLIYMHKDTDYAYEAMKLRASGYLKKPFDINEVENELEYLRYPETQRKLKRMFAQTFGNFELFVDGEPVVFKYTRTKEIMAILVNNRGAQTTNGEIIASLWEDEGDPEKKLSYLRNLRQDLLNTFNRLKLEGILIKQRGSMAVAKDRIECDLYDWLDNGNESRYRYMGEYMNQYSWSEYYHAELDEISYDLEEDAHSL